MAVLIDPETGRPFDPSIPTKMGLAANNRVVPFNTGANVTDVLGKLWDASKLQGLVPEMTPMGSLPNLPIAARTAGNAIGTGAKAGAREIAKQIETGTGVFGKGTIDPRMYMYLPDTPTKPNPLVGTRFVSESANNLVPETILPIEKLKGASLVKTPYDNTNAGQIISEISGDIKLQNPVSTMGGDDFARLINNYNQNIGGASNYGIASRVGNRFDIARKENLATKGGTGEVYSAPVTMSQKEPSEAFSTYPTEIGMQILNQQGNKQSIKEFNEWFRNSGLSVKKGDKSVTIRPFGNFKGIETPEGQAQLLTGEGFDAGGTAGNARKNFFSGLSLDKFERMFDYNMKDVRGAVNDPRFANLPKGYVKGNLIQTFENTALTPSSMGSKIGAYDTDIAGKYAGTIKPTPIEILMPKTYNRIYAEMVNKYPKASNIKLHNMTLGAMEKRKDKFSEVIDQEIIDNYYQFHEGLLGK